ncbi:hypothetical protein ACPB8Q_06190 [Methanocaldococcus indicus]|uniref:hypothetical protein n=1 Tax=Methanocaldococcus indicus TaxID=213231 RepID=UPI003C6DA99E
MIFIYLRHRRAPKVDKEGDEEICKEIINSLLNNEYKIFFLPSGSAGVFLSIFIAKKFYDTILVPDMGGWKGFLKYPKIFNLNIEKIETNLGVIENINYKDKALILTSLSGYLAENPLKEIREACDENNILFIEDISNKIGGDCGYGDLVVCSTGSPKILNCEYGGFLGIKEEIFKKIKDEFLDIYKTYKTINYFNILKEELLEAKKTYRLYIKSNNFLKKRIKNTYFKNSESLSIFIECNNPRELSKIINSKIKLDNKKSLTTICPTYDRILRKGVVFETKKIEKRDLKENLKDILRVLVEVCSLE